MANDTRHSFFFIVIKESDYNIMIMSTLSGLTVLEGHKEERKMANEEIFNFKYPEVFANCYIYRGQWKIIVT